MTVVTILLFQREHASTVSLNDENDGRLSVSITDAVSELETVKFTIQTKVSVENVIRFIMNFKVRVDLNRYLQA